MTGYSHADPGRKRTVPTILILAFLGLLASVGFAFQAGFLSSTASPVAEAPTDIVISSQRLDFGTIPPNGTATRQLVMRNEGPEAVEATLTAEGDAYQVSPDRLILHPGISTRISVVLTAAAEGRFDDELRIEIDDSVASTLLIALAGRVAHEEPLATPASVPATERLRVALPEAENRTTARSRRPAGARTDTTSTAPETGVLIAAARPSATKATRKPTSGGRGQATVEQSPRKRVSGERKPREPRRDDTNDSNGSTERGRRSLSINVQPYNPATAAPFRDLTETAPPFDEQIAPEEAENAARIPSRIPGGNDNELPDQLPEDEERDSMFDDDIFDDSNDLEPSDDPLKGPSFTISGVSTIRILGSAATFYPQEIPVVGQAAGGPLSLTQIPEFPVVPLAFGESMLFAPTRNVVGSFDSISGEVKLELGLQAVDSDGDAAPLNFTMTTGTSFGRNQAGVVVSISGTPRAADTGIVRLVGIQKIPMGYRNGAEQHLVIVEILASLDFGSSIQPSAPSRLDRIGG